MLNFIITRMITDSFDLPRWLSFCCCLIGMLLPGVSCQQIRWYNRTQIDIDGNRSSYAIRHKWFSLSLSSRAFHRHLTSHHLFFFCSQSHHHLNPLCYEFARVIIKSYTTFSRLKIRRIEWQRSLAGAATAVDKNNLHTTYSGGWQVDKSIWDGIVIQSEDFKQHWIKFEAATVVALFFLHPSDHCLLLLTTAC